MVFSFLSETFYNENEIKLINLIELENELKQLKNELMKNEFEIDDAKLILNFLKLWKYQLQNQINSLQIIVLEIVTLLITFCKLNGYKNIGNEFIKSVANQFFLSTLYRNLNQEKKWKLIHVTLQLLSCIVFYSSVSANDLFNQFNFNLKSLSLFLSMRKIITKKSMDHENQTTPSEKGNGTVNDADQTHTDSYENDANTTNIHHENPKKNDLSANQNADDILTRDIRGVYIKFLLGFLHKGDPLVKKNLLETKNLLHLIFKDMKNDSFELVDFILSTFHLKVLNDNRIPKTTKLHFFHQGTLLQLSNLYLNSNPAKHSSNLATASKSDDSKTIANLIHEFFLQLCTTPGQGICFQDHGWYPNTNQQQSQNDEKQLGISNHLLGKFLLSLKISTDLLQRDLFLKIIQVCPELVHYYWQNATHLSFEPRSSVYYIANIALVSSVVQKSIPMFFHGKSVYSVLSPPPIPVCISNILPSQLSKQISSKALQHASGDVRFACCRQLAVSFEKLERVLEMAEKSLLEIKAYDRMEIWQLEKLDLEWSKWKNELLETFRFQLPDPNIIILLHKSARAPPLEDDEIDQHDLVTSHLVLLKYYLKHNRRALLETKYDFGKLLNSGGVSLTDEKSGWNNETLLLTIQILHQVEGFKWWNRNDQKQSFFRVLLDLYLVIAVPHLKKEMENLFSRFFESTSCFQGHAASLPSFLKLVWNQGHEIAELIETHIISFAPKGEKTEKMIHDDEDIAIPPLYSQLLRSWESNCSGPVKVFISGLVVQDCLDSGLASTCEKYLNQIPDDKDCFVLKCLLAWLEHSCGKKKTDISFIKSIDWKEVKEMLNENDANQFIQSLFKISITSFHKKWKKLVKKYEHFSLFFQKHIQLTARLTDFAVDLEVVEYIVPRDSSILLELLFHPNISENATNTISALTSKLESNESGISIQQILFYLDCWVIRFGLQRKGPMAFIFRLLFSLLERKPNYIHQVHDHPAMLFYFLPNNSDYKFDAEPFKAALPIITLKSSCQNRFKAKFMEHLYSCTDEKKTGLSPLAVQSFQALVDNFDSLELDSIANTILKKRLQEKSMNEILWSCIERNRSGSSQVLLDAIMLRDDFKVSIQSLLERRKGMHRFEFINLIDQACFLKMIKNRSEEFWKLVCWICSFSLIHSLWLADWVRSKEIESLSKSEKHDIFTSLIKLLFCPSIGKWREGIPRPLWKWIKSLSKSISEKMVDRISDGVIGASFDLLTKSDALLVKAITEINEMNIMEAIENCVNSRFTREKLDLEKSIVNVVAVFKILMRLAHPGLCKTLSNVSISLISFYYLEQKDEKNGKLEETILELIDLITSCSEFSIHDKDIYTEFISISLQYRITCISSLKLLKFLVKKSDNLLPPFEIIDNIISNPLFDTVIESILEENKTIPTNHECKSHLLDVMQVLLEFDPFKCCKIEIARKLALQYYGTTSKSDLASLRIFSLFEKAGHISMSDFLSCWGNQVDSKSACFSEALINIDNVWMANTIHWFPISKEVDVFDDNSLSIYSHKCQPMYDPSFFLPLAAAALVDKNNPIDVHRALETNVIGLAVMALSSRSLHTRQIGHFIIYKFYEALQESHVKEKNQVLLLLDNLRNSIISTHADPFPIISGIIASFVAQGLMILIKPESDMYPLINRFCLQRDQIDLHDIPMFYELFYSTSIDCRRERIWVLRLIFYGLESKLDYQLLARRHAFPILFSFFHSSIADTVTRKLIFEILIKASKIPSAVSNLVTKCGLLVFLKFLCSTLSFNSNNDLSLGFPTLIESIFKGFMESPTDWDGKLNRKEWLVQFLEIIQLLLSILENLSFSKKPWACTFTMKTLQVCKTVVEAANKATMKSILNVKNLKSIQRTLSRFSSKLNGDTKNELYLSQLTGDIDLLFAVEDESRCSISLAENMFFDIILASFATDISVDLVLWCLERSDQIENRKDLLCWILRMLVAGKIHNGMSDLEKKSLLLSLYELLLNIDSSDIEAQLARACLVILIRDWKVLERKRKASDESHGGFKYRNTIAEFVHLTPSPMYLLNVDNQDLVLDSFQQLLFGQLLSCFGQESNIGDTIQKYLENNYSSS